MMRACTHLPPFTTIGAAMTTTRTPAFHKPLQLLAAAAAALALALGVIAAFAAQPAFAEESQGNPPVGKQVVLDYDSSKPVEVGGYYFKAGEVGNLEYSALASGPWTSTDMFPQQTFIESSVAYYLSYNGKDGKHYLMKYDLEKGREDTIDKLGESADAVGALYDNLLFINYSNYDNFTVYVRVYDLNEHKLRSTRIKNTCIRAASGEYVSFVSELHTDVSPYKLYLGRLTANGTIADKRLIAQRSFNSNFVGNKLWFCSYKNIDMGGTMYVKSVETKNGLGAKVKTVHTYKAKRSNMQMAMNFQKTRYGLITFPNNKVRHYLVAAKTGKKTRFYPAS